jgi:predicted ArsR family transcriptional regulator
MQHRFVLTNRSWLLTKQSSTLSATERGEILQCLRTRPAAVGELAQQLPVSRPAISQHLRVLRECDLVSFATFGTRNVYRLETSGLESLRSWLEDFWTSVLDGFATYVGREAGTDGPITGTTTTTTTTTKGLEHA